jgi:protein-S-isoprenylcysteine O-methyltransferase Ste14
MNGGISVIRRISAFIYGLITYGIFLVTFLYAVGFLGNVIVPKSIDSARQESLVVALLVNLLLLTVFAVQHSGMARPRFKTWWTRIVPKPVERSTYVLLTSVALILLFWAWQPMGGVVWDVQGTPLAALAMSLFVFGWLLVLVSTFLINHFDLFGLRQVWLYLRGEEYTPLGFVTPGPYKWIRHPLYVGWFLAFWATPTMTAAHLVFALATTAYILVAIRFEERDLIDAHGAPYAEYRKRVPMLVPDVLGKRASRSKIAQPQSDVA